MEQCLQHPYFSEIRELDYETKHKGKLNFDFEKGNKSLEEIKKLLYEEMMEFHKDILSKDQGKLPYPVKADKYLLTIDLDGKFIKLSKCFLLP